jgi:cyclopropane fatty-acyl-phospholipid synthase-like methyltransferase
MFRWTEPGHYFAVGESARKCIEASLAAAEKRDIRRILDFGCGYGRVLRVLRKEFPDATITASDIDRDAVDFCTAQFGVKGIYSSADPNDVQFDDWFDLIWVGTVFTQLDKTSWEAWLPALRDALADDGVLIFTTIGPPRWRKSETANRIMVSRRRP